VVLFSDNSDYRSRLGRNGASEALGRRQYTGRGNRIEYITVGKNNGLSLKKVWNIEKS
jgi:hypothetical protein